MITKAIQTNKHIEKQEMEEKTVLCKQFGITVKIHSKTKTIYYF